MILEVILIVHGLQLSIEFKYSFEGWDLSLKARRPQIKAIFISEKIIWKILEMYGIL